MQKRGSFGVSWVQLQRAARGLAGFVHLAELGVDCGTGIGDAWIAGVSSLCHEQGLDGDCLISHGGAGETQVVSGAGVPRIEFHRSLKFRQSFGCLAQFIPCQREFEPKLRILRRKTNRFLQFCQCFRR